MSKNDKRTDKPPIGKRPYEKPAIVSGEVFETMALSCANVDAQSCPGFITDRS